MMNQALRYQNQTKIDLSDFFKSTEGKIKSEEGKQVEKEIRKGFGSSHINSHKL